MKAHLHPALTSGRPRTGAVDLDRLPAVTDAASQAFDRFGRGRGRRGRLNFGDCMAYAVSAAMRAPLLFEGGDFGLMDVMAHPASIRT